MQVSAPTAPPSSSSRKFHIPSLDGLRAIAFLLVFTAHSGLGHIIPGGSFGVTIFFFMSGYLITTLLRKEYERRGAINFRRFYLRRWLRILPPLYLVLGLALLAVALGWLPQSLEQLDPGALIAQIFHFSNYWIAFKGYDGQILGTDVLWALAVEEQFYLLFPLFYALLCRLQWSSKQQAWTFWGLCLLVLAWRCVLVFGFHVPEDRTYMGLDTRMDSILFGCALAVHSNPALDPVHSSWSNRVWKWVWLPLGLGLLAGTLLIKLPEFRDTARYSLQGIALYPVFITAIRFPQWGVFRLLNYRLLCWVGVISYGLYLTHRTIAYILLGQWPQLPLFAHVALMFALSLGISGLIYVGLEQPITRLKNHLAAPSR